jgi:hypothetical protein
VLLRPSGDDCKYVSSFSMLLPSCRRLRSSSAVAIPHRAPPIKAPRSSPPSSLRTQQPSTTKRTHACRVRAQHTHDATDQETKARATARARASPIHPPHPSTPPDDSPSLPSSCAVRLSRDGVLWVRSGQDRASTGVAGPAEAVARSRNEGEGGASALSFLLLFPLTSRSRSSGLANPAVVVVGSARASLGCARAFSTSQRARTRRARRAHIAQGTSLTPLCFRPPLSPHSRTTNRGGCPHV